MDQHQRIAALLHAATSGVELLLLALLLVTGGALIALMLPHRDALQMGAMVGVMALVLGAFVALELLAAIGCLRGWPLARPALERVGAA